MGQRKLADSVGGKLEVVATGQNTPLGELAVSERLMDEKEKIDGFITEEEARKHQYELDLKKVEADLAHFRWRHEKDSKVWKFWKIWSEHLNNLEKEIARLEKREKSLRDLINTTAETVGNLKDAKQWTHDASERAKNHEKRIESLHSQLEDAKQVHVETVQANAVAERQAKEASDEKLRV